MAVLIFPFLMLAFFVCAVLVCAPAIIDLIRRDDEVTAWWALPYVLLMLPVTAILLLPLAMDTPYEKATVSALFWAGVHFSAAGLMLVGALCLAAVRGLRPLGPTQRRRRTSVVAIGVLVVLFVLPFFPHLGWMIWVVPVSFSGVLWVIGVNRRGPSRLERGKAASAAMLVGAAIQLMLFFAHLSFFFDKEDPAMADALIWVWIPSGLLLALLVGGLRVLSGAMPVAVPVLSMLSAGSVVLPAVWWSTRPAVEAPVPVWEDLVGGYGASLRAVRRPECVRTPDQPKAEHYPCRYDEEIAYPPSTPLSEVATSGKTLVEGGRHTTSWGRWLASDVKVEEVNGMARVNGGERLFSVGPDLHAHLQEVATAGPLRVKRTPAWTLQQYVSMCASTGPGPDCDLVR